MLLIGLAGQGSLTGISMRLSKIIIAAFVLCLMINTAHAVYKFNPYTGKLDYYEAETASSIATKLTTTVLPVAAGGTGNSINAGRLYEYKHTVVSVGGTLSETALYTKTIPANTFGPNGCIKIIPWVTYTNSANNKIFKVKIGSTAFFTHTVTTFGVYRYAAIEIRNRNATNIQQAINGTAGGFGPATAVLGALDTTQDQILTITGQTTLETGFATTAVVGLAGTCTATKASHGLNSGEYVQAAGGANCPTSGNPNADPVQITVSDANTFTYACSCVGTEAGTQPTVKRYSVITLESVDVEILKP